MAVFYLRNSLNPDGLVVPVTVKLNLIQDVPEADGEDIWVIEFNTHVKDVNGDRILTKTINVRVSEQDIEQVIESGLALIGAEVDWGTLQSDTVGPYVDYFSISDTEGVPIMTPVIFKLRDLYPSVGIDPNSITLVVNDIDVTDQLDIDSFATYTRVKWNAVRITSQVGMDNDL